MNENSLLFQIGEIVKTTKGRDSGKFGIVIGYINDNFVTIADGDKRKYDRPKKKNIRHVVSTRYISEEIVQSINENGRVSNAKLRYIIQDYVSNHLKEVN